MTVDLTNPVFTDPDAARLHLESVRWPNGPVCPHCGTVEEIGELEGQVAPAGPVQVLRLPPAVHRDGRHRFRALEDPAEQVTSGHVPAVRFEEGHRRQARDLWGASSAVLMRIAR